ncbi:cystathionine beta-lyase [Bacilli bacterium PM5-3]|nr:cystathionine beta-lyase [Bacilli bacterium PM5-3]
MKYNFDEVVDRSNTNSMKVQGSREYLFPNNLDINYLVSDEEMVKMWVADMEFATPQVIIDKVKERLDRRIFGYTKIFDEGYYEAFKDWTNRRYGWHCNKEDLVTSPGIIPALYELAALILDEQEKIITFTPAYGFFLHTATHVNRELVCSSLVKDDNGKMVIDFADFRKKAEDPKVKMLLLSNPHNPNGIIWTKEQLIEIEKICRENNVWIISDEIHCDLLRTGKQHIPMAKLASDNDMIVTCMSPSKSFNMAGLMLSNIVIPNKELMKKWKETHYDMENPLSVVAIQAAYAEGEDWLKEMLLYLDKNFEFLASFLKEKLPEAKFEIPDATYLAWIDLSAYFKDDSIDLAEFFAEKAGVLLEAGNQFVKDGEGYVRLNLACPKAMLEDALNKVCKAIEMM